MKYVSIICFILLVGCSTSYGEYDYGSGYKVMPTDAGTYRIEYFSRYSIELEDLWTRAATELCKEKYDFVYAKTNTVTFDMYVPISGNNVNVGRQEFIRQGEVACPQGISGLIPVHNAAWKEFNQETKSVKPVSEDLIYKKIGLNVGSLTKLPVRGAQQALVERWGKPASQEAMGNDRIFIWFKGGNSWFQNRVLLSERDGVLEFAAVIPGAAAVFMDQYFKNNVISRGLLSKLMNGEIPAYFYIPEA